MFSDQLSIDTDDAPRTIPVPPYPSIREVSTTASAGRLAL